MGLLSRLFGRSRKPVVCDLQGSEEKRIEQEGRTDLGGKDEKLARRLNDLLSEPMAGAGTHPRADLRRGPADIPTAQEILVAEGHELIRTLN